MSQFIDDLRKGKIRQPTQRGFSVETWENSWDAIESNDARSEEVYQTGKVLYNHLTEIRRELDRLYDRFPKSSLSELIQLYIGISNRDAAVLARYEDISNDAVNNAFNPSVTIRLSGNTLTKQEIADNCVDGVELALRACVKKASEGAAPSPSRYPMDVLEFASREAMLSQLYGMYESYWSAMLWGDFRFLPYQSRPRTHVLAQEASLKEAGALRGQIRKQKLAAHLAGITASKFFQNLFLSRKAVTIERSGKAKRLVSTSVAKLPQKLRQLYAVLATQAEFLSDEIPEDLLKKEHHRGISAHDIVPIFRCLSIIAHQIIEKYPQNDSISSKTQLLHFCPCLKKAQLVNSISKSLDIPKKKVICALEFLEYRGAPKQDLWCNPIIPTKNSCYALLTSALSAPVLVRSVENWLAQMGADLADKGPAYERVVSDAAIGYLEENEHAKDYDCASSFHIAASEGGEEIDLLIRIGSVVLIGEVKSIVTTDSPISQYRTFERLQIASEQAIRKSHFIKQNLKEAFRSRGWDFKECVEYTVVACVVNSGRMFIGENFNGVPIVDEHVLGAYFRSAVIPLFSEIPRDSLAERHLAWFTLYDDFTSMQANLSSYLSSPPQLNPSHTPLALHPTTAPRISDSSDMVIYARLVPHRLELKEILSLEHSFPISLVEDFEMRAKEFDVVF